MLRILLSQLFVLLAFGANASPVNLAGRQIEVVIPSGYCALSEENPSDAEVIRVTKAGMENGSNQILVLFADCKEQSEVRGGKRQTYDNYGQILAQMRKGKLEPLKGVSRSEFIRKIGGTSPTVNVNQVVQSAVARYNAALSGGSISYDAQKPYWLISDQNGSFYGMLGQLVDVYGKKSNLFAVLGISLIKEMSLTINIYQKFKGEPPVAQLLAKQQAAMAALVLGNN